MILLVTKASLENVGNVGIFFVCKGHSALLYSTVTIYDCFNKGSFFKWTFPTEHFMSKIVF